MVSELCYRFSAWNESRNFWVREFAENIYFFFCEMFLEKNSIFGFLEKNTQIEKKNRSNRISDEGDIVDLKSTLLLENFATVGQLQCARANNLHALRYKMHAKL